MTYTKLKNGVFTLNYDNLKYFYVSVSFVDKITIIGTLRFLRNENLVIF